MNKKNLPAANTEEDMELAEVQMDPEVLAQIDQDLGKGVSTDASDNLIPLIYVLHPLSPQVIDGPAHIEGAKGGDIWLKNFSGNPIVPGKEGIWFQPCTMYQKWTEWIPRAKGGGFIASYDYNGGKLPEGAVRDENEKKRPKYFFPDTGNDCVDTRYEAGIVWYKGAPYPYVIPFKSTGHKVSRGWMTKRTGLMKPGRNAGIWPSWSHVYKLTTSLQSNNLGQWYLFEVGAPQFYMIGFQDKPYREGLKVVGGDPNRAYMLGKSLAAAFASGKVTEAPEDEDTGEDRGSYPEDQQRRDDNIPY
jgi:hypothetical protein